MWEEYLVPSLIAFNLALITLLVSVVVLLFNNIKRIEDKLNKLNEDIAYLRGIIEGGKYVNKERKREI